MLRFQGERNLCLFMGKKYPSVEFWERRVTGVGGSVAKTCLPRLHSSAGQLEESPDLHLMNLCLALHLEVTLQAQAHVEVSRVGLFHQGGRPRLPQRLDNPWPEIRPR